MLVSEWIDSIIEAAAVDHVLSLEGAQLFTDVR